MTASLSHHRNPRIYYDHGVLYLESPDPLLCVFQTLTRLQAFRFGLRCLWASIRPAPTYPYAPGVQAKLRSLGL